MSTKAPTEPWADVFTGRTVLITGGAGMVGSRMANRLVDVGAHVLVLDTLDAYPFDYGSVFLHDRVEVRRGDIRDNLTVRECVGRSDFVIHAAAFADVAGSVLQPQTDFENNVVGTQSVLEACRDSGVQGLAFVSSASVYGDRSPVGELEEKMASGPVSTYGNSKAWGERQTILYHDLYGLPTVALRYFSVYGTPQVPKQGSHSWCVAWFVMKAARGQPMTLNGGGRQVRDFTHVDDIAAGTLRALAEPGAHGRVLNLGTGTPTEVQAVAALVGQHYPESTVDTRPHQLGDPIGGYASTKTLRETLGWVPEIGLRDGVASYIEWVEANRHLIPDFI